jgi:hypothetical protein
VVLLRLCAPDLGQFPVLDGAGGVIVVSKRTLKLPPVSNNLVLGFVFGDRR